MKISFVLLLLFTSSFAQAGPRVNNGGGVWVCRNAITENVNWIKTMDLFLMESRIIKPLKFENRKSWDIYRSRLDVISKSLPELSKLLEKFPLNLETMIKFQKTDLDVVQDANIDVRPLKASCPNGRVGFEQIADFFADNILIINSKLWDQRLLSEIDKAALLLHEHLYYILRKTNDEPSSWRAQRLVIALLSDISIAEMKSLVAEILNQNSRVPRAEDSVVLFPVDLQCRASIDSVTVEGAQESYRPLAKKWWKDFSEGATLSSSLQNYTFFVRTSPLDGRPLELSILDTQSGIKSEQLASVTNASFRLNHHAHLSMRDTKASTAISLECWTN